MDMKWLLLSLDGRVTRASMWAFTGVYLVAGIMIAVVAPGEIDPETGQPVMSDFGGVLFLLFVVLFFWPSIAISVKRCHDRGRSGWFMLVSAIPLVNFWYLVEMLFLRGTVGDNRFGPDPLAGQGKSST
ncbi:MAG: hypothetical protein A2516_05360 [Alphaproteobacteria bacterium RIFOXYD12_FULL_60_8]|nr:MAG: hypothetical protein A2516_05360 [Alphaproteobacteria bacterium RIFOXYD12_FULL_60_8]